MLYSNCHICPRECGVDRTAGKQGVCGMDSEPSLARAALHYWEEPCISGKKGSGTVFFSGCSLRCVYCQNHLIAIGEVAKKVDAKRLVEIYFELKDKGAHNINLVTASHFLPHVIDSITEARSQGFDLPFVYNTSGYEKKDSLLRLEGLIDIYLPDYKYALSCDAERYSSCPDYPEIAVGAIDEMLRQQPQCVFMDGIMQKGVIVRHLLLPGKLIESKIAVKRLYERYGDSIYISLMSQYTPLPQIKAYPELDRCVSEHEYKSLIDYASGLGITKAYTQLSESAKESFIPLFDYEGV